MILQCFHYTQYFIIKNLNTIIHAMFVQCSMNDNLFRKAITAHNPWETYTIQIAGMGWLLGLFTDMDFLVPVFLSSFLSS